MGKLIYLTNTRPDISYDVHCLNQFMHSPLNSHLKITFKILRYLKSCLGLGIHITKTSGMFLNAYSDADWAKCIVTRKSVTGYYVFLNNSLVFWKSKKQNTLFKSSTEAEYRALASVTSEVIWILKFLKDLQIENFLPVSLHCDSNSAIKIAANPVFHERTKHLEIDLHFVREKILKGVVKTVKVDSTNQIEDILTKGLDIVQHLELVKRLGMFDVYQYYLFLFFIMSVHNYVHISDNGDDYIEDPDPVTLISKLDISHPLHLHPNDTTNLTVVSIKLKGTENYQVWSCAMFLALEGKNKTGFIDGTCKRSNTDKVLGKQWDRVNTLFWV
ncbi:ribonuclease H-like domain-containing protein [Tanacetum coccineum]